MSISSKFLRGLLAIVAGALVGSSLAQTVNTGWVGYGGNAQHTGISSFRSDRYSKILWQTPMDAAPPYSGNELLIHYGEPAVTQLNTVIIPVRQANGTFVIEAHSMSTGALLWSQASGYTLPSYSWVPSMGISLMKSYPTPSHNNQIGTNLANTSVVYPESGGRIAIRTNADSASGTTTTVAFYGNAVYNSNPTAFDQNVQICTPLTVTPNGAIFFGFTAGTNPANLVSGIAEVKTNGTGVWVSATAASGDSGINRVQMNCAPALSNDSRHLYIAVAAGYWDRGYLLSLNTADLSTAGKTSLIDPYSGADAGVLSDSTASPLVGPDGSVFFGVFESSYGTNHARGYLLHFDSTLSTSFTPGSFGWDLTPTIVPASLVPSYTGTSKYLLVCKYNNYAETGGNGVNQIALLDPNATQVNEYNSAVVMKEVATLTGPTPDTYYISQGFPNAVREWCINSAAVDVPGDCVIVNCEDGVLYKWDLTTLKIRESMRLTAGIGEAYTPTVIAPSGQVLAINNAILFVVGSLFGSPPAKIKS